MITDDNYRNIPTTPAVWIAIRNAHREEMVVFASFSAPRGNYYGNPEQAIMETAWGFPSAMCPTLVAETTWDVDHEAPSNRPNEKTQYWLCAPKEVVE